MKVAGLAHGSFTLHWIEPEDNLLVPIHVMPRIPGLPDRLVEQVMVEVMGDSWMAPVPAMTLFAGSAQAPTHGAGPFQEITALRFVQNDPAMGSLNRTWLVGDHRGITSVTGRGEVSPLLPGVPGTITALAVRPQGGPADPRFHVVFAQEVPGKAASESSTGIVWSLDPDGRSRIVACAAGNVPFGRIKALALDPVSGHLYVGEGKLIRRVSRDGVVKTLLDSDGEQQKLERLLTLGMLSEAAGVELAQRGPALLGVSGLEVHGKRLFIGDFGSDRVQVLYLDTRMTTTLAGAPGSDQVRMGPLGLFSPGLAESACAALPGPRALAINAEGTCLLALEHGLAQLDLHTLAQPAPGIVVREEPPAGCSCSLM